MRSLAQLREQFDVERELALALWQAPPDVRRSMYPAVYAELFRRVSHHPHNVRRHDPVAARKHVEAQLAILSPHINNNSRVLEIGAGDGSFAAAAAQHVAQYVAVDVATDHVQVDAANCTFHACDGVTFDVPPGTIDVAYSYQVVEHLHPDDVIEQTAAIYNVLAPKGTYVCVTPHAYMGPSDISRFFSHRPLALHLHEYTNKELARIFTEVGFSRVFCQVSLKIRQVLFPVWVVGALEGSLGWMPHRLRRRLTQHVPLRPILSICMVGIK
jgi:SAM-dependent methyltransferase